MLALLIFSLRFNRIKQLHASGFIYLQYAYKFQQLTIEELDLRNACGLDISMDSTILRYTYKYSTKKLQLNFYSIWNGYPVNVANFNAITVRKIPNEIQNDFQKIIAIELIQWNKPFEFMKMTLNESIHPVLV